MKTYNEMTDSEKIDQLYAWIGEIHSWVKPQYVRQMEYQQTQRRLDELNWPSRRERKGEIEWTYKQCLIMPQNP